MNFKKIICMLLVAALAITALVGCGKKVDEEEPRGPYSASDIALEKVADSKLSDDEMLGVVKEYYSVFDAIFAATGEDIVTDVVVGEDGSVSINTSRPELDEGGNRTGKTIEDKDLMAWASAREAFAYLFEQGQVDLDGNLMFDKDDLIEQATNAQNGASDTTTLDEDNGSDNSTDAEADSDVVENSDDSAEGEDGADNALSDADVNMAENPDDANLDDEDGSASE